MITLEPMVVLLHDFATETEYKNLIDAAAGDLEPAHVQAGDGDSSAVDAGRVANATWIDHQDRATKKLSLKVDAITGFDPNYAEPWHVISYQEGGHYAPHFDYLIYASDSVQALQGNRIATFLLYLKTAEEGGGTVFTDLNLRLQPKPGDAILWFDMYVDGTRQGQTMHGGCPVLKGHKAAATLWIRERGQELRVRCPVDKMDFDPTSFFKGALNVDVDCKYL